MTHDEFWAVIDGQLSDLRTARNADGVLRILATDHEASEGFFAGSGGDGSVMEALSDAGWSLVWAEASYHYAMRAPDGSVITYVEGDIYRGNRKPIGHEELP